MKRELGIVSLFISVCTLDLIQTQDVSRYAITTERRFVGSLVQHSADTYNMFKCIRLCTGTSRCKSVNPSSGKCKLIPLPFQSISKFSSSDSGWTIYSRYDWMLVFLGVSGNNVDVYESFVSGTNVVTDDIACLSLNMPGCLQHFRNPIVESWDSLPITKGKFALNKNYEEVAYVVFNGTGGSSLTDWFSSPNMLESSWTDAMATTYERFSSNGDRHC